MAGYDGRGAKFPLTIVRGADMAFTVTATDSDAAAIDLSAATIAGEVYDGDGTLVDTFTAAVSGAGSNIITLSFTDTETAALTSGAYTWTLWVTRGGDKRPWLAGPVRLTSSTNGGPGSSGTAVTATVDSDVSVTVSIAAVGASLYDDIVALPTDTAPATTDLIPFVDVDAARTESVTVANLAASAAFAGQYAPIVRADLSEAASGATNLAALEAAATEAATAGATLYLPPGEFDIAGPWVISQWLGMRIVGAGHLVTVLNNTATDGSNAIEVAQVSVGTKWSQLFEDFTVQGNASSGSGIVLGMDNALLGPVTFRRVGALSNGGNGFETAGRTDQLLLDSCIARANVGFGYQIGISSSLLSEVTFLNCHGNTNTGGGVTVVASTTVANFIGCEFGNNIATDMVIGDVLQTNLMGTYFESGGTNVHPFVEKTTGAGRMMFTGCAFSDLSTAGMSTQVLLNGFPRAVFDGCTFSLKTGGVGVDENAGANLQTFFRGCRKSTAGNFRRLADNSATDVLNGGPSAYRPASPAAGDTYYDTTLGIPLWWDGSAWLGSDGGVADREFRIVNQYYTTDMPCIAASTTPTYQRFRGAPFIVTAPSRFDIALVRVGTAGAGATFRIAVYDSNFDLVYDESSTADLSATGVQSVTLTTPLDLAPGLYWVGGSPQGTSQAGLRMYGSNLADPTANGQSMFTPITSFMSTGGFIESADTVSGAHPSSLTSPAVPSTGACVSVGLRYTGTY